MAIIFLTLVIPTANAENRITKQQAWLAGHLTGLMDRCPDGAEFLKAMPNILSISIRAEEQQPASFKSGNKNGNSFLPSQACEKLANIMRDLRTLD